VDAVGHLVADLECLADQAVPSVGGERAGVFKHKAVRVDAVPRGFQGGDELLGPDDEDDVVGTPDVGGELGCPRPTR
jgi:hypothetical protein